MALPSKFHVSVDFGCLLRPTSVSPVPQFAYFSPFSQKSFANLSFFGSSSISRCRQWRQSNKAAWAYTAASLKTGHGLLFFSAFRFLLSRLSALALLLLLGSLSVRALHRNAPFPVFHSFVMRFSSTPSFLHSRRSNRVPLLKHQLDPLSLVEPASELEPGNVGEMLFLFQLPTETSEHSELFLTNRVEPRIKGNGFVKIAAGKVSPAVVRLDTERFCTTANRAKPNGLIYWFRGHLVLSKKELIRERGMGSGFVVDGQKGLIVTNFHVIDGAENVKVMFCDGREFDAQIIGVDEVADLAIVKVPNRVGELLPEAPLGDSRTVELGDWVIAVGNPFGLDNTISLGIISNLHRTATEVGISGKQFDLFQTDCAINPGSSGGPLVNEFGEVIGINTAIRADAEGIAFAIPIDNVKHVIQALSEGSKTKHPYLGIEVSKHPDIDSRNICDDLIVVPKAEGVLVLKVFLNSPAVVAGLQPSDIILELEGETISNAFHLQRLIQISSVGQVLSMKVWRDDKYLDLAVTISELYPLYLKGGERGELNQSSTISGNFGHDNRRKLMV